jgi:hypothetical protein
MAGCDYYSCAMDETLNIPGRTAHVRNRRRALLRSLRQTVPGYLSNGVRPWDLAYLYAGGVYDSALHPDLAALCHAGLARRRREYRGISSGHWEYAATAAGRGMILHAEQEGESDG